jgi:hypothetical protein
MYTIDLAVAEDGSRYHCVPLTKKGDIAYDYAVMLGADGYGGLLTPARQQPDTRHDRARSRA